MSYNVDEDEIRRLSNRLAEEFNLTYGTLDEKVARVSDDAALAIADECCVHLEVARVAYRVMLDGVIPDHKPSCRILMQEFDRRAKQGSPVPEIDTYQREVAVKEGKWVEYLYGQLGKVLVGDLRNLVNLERTIADEIEPANEQVIAVLAQRKKMNEGCFKPLIERWINDHEGANIYLAIQTIAGGLIGYKVPDVPDAVNGARASLLIKLRRYEQFLSQEDDEEESRLLAKVLGEIQILIKEVQGPLEAVSIKTAGEILIEASPPPPESLEEQPKGGFIHSPFPSKPRMGPPLKTPLDFLERDVWLASMKAPDERASFLREKISTVTSNLIEQGTPLDRIGETIIFDLDSRFSWTRSKKTIIREELREIRDSAGEDYRAQIEAYILENLLAKIPQLRSKTNRTED
ncbi:hypothetical protein E2P64_08475 [Candidatus Bathyarchaeota archaeon]|nr:hypothetical protein E2P64_08475 [Candidatus Bathyarchaeota archaeon]